MLTLNTEEKDDLVLFSDISSDFRTKYNRKLVPKVISLIDMDAFFAQVCHIVYNIPREKPLAVIHNNLVLALNYPSKEKGLNRGMSKEQVLSICPEIVIPKNIFVDALPAYKGGENEHSPGKNYDFNLHLEDSKEQSKTKYTKTDEVQNDADKKVSLDIFRKASKLVFKLLTSYLPYCKSQIASIDEIYFDLTELIINIFDVYIEIEYETDCIECIKKIEELNKYLCISSEYSIDESNIKDLMKNKKIINYIELLFPELFKKEEFRNIVCELYDYNENTSVNNNNEDSNSSYFGITNLTFKEMCLIIGSTIIYRARKRLLNETTYTCSSGIYVNKLYSKMMSSMRKPNNQVLLLPRWFERYISETNVLKLRYLGGKLGRRITELLPKVSTIKDLQKYNVLQLIDLFGNKNGTYLYNSSRGIDNDSVVSNNKISSMQSSKIFGIPLKNIDDVEKWLKVFSNELYHRNYNNYKQYKNKPTKIGVKLKDSNGIIKIKTSDFRYKSDIPTVNEIYECSKHILYTKFDNNGADISFTNKRKPANVKFPLPCKYLGVSLSGYARIVNNKKISFGFLSNSKIKKFNNTHADNNMAFNCKNGIQTGNDNDTHKLVQGFDQDNLNTEYFDTDLILMEELESQITESNNDYYTTKEDFIHGSHVISNITSSQDSIKIKKIYNNWPFEYKYLDRKSTLSRVKKKSTNLSIKRIPSSNRKIDLIDMTRPTNSRTSKGYIQTKLPFK
ncbi:hypothetical protein FG379_000931 [Cryptosporidium bovis]|uniref:uncharacterized protein n=1 Tax=Cryptosporidium bovis TaxID=310047 RepID=UPI00351AAC44|nr:hypothetical protein FG379_000931 [Cryptosporidium bovis]